MIVKQGNTAALNVAGIEVVVATIGDDHVQTVNARELHSFLGVGTDFSTWIKGRIEKYGFSEGVDYTVRTSPGSSRIFGNSHPSPRTAIEYHISLDMAKELAMVENNAKGREARRYFIQCEKRLRAQEATQLDTPESRIRLLETALAAERRAQEEATRAAAAEAAREREAVARIAAEATTAKLQTTVDQSVLFARSVFGEGHEAHISTKDIKNGLVPWLAEDKIRLILNFYGHPKTKFQFGDHENAVLTVFQRDGLREVLDRFTTDATSYVSSSGKTLVVAHDCLLGATIRVSKTLAIRHLGYAEDDFTG